MWKVGDKYIHFTKYGGVNKGVVVDLHEQIRIDYRNKCEYKVNGIVIEIGIVLWLDEDEVYKITKDDNFTEKEVSRKYERIVF